MPDIFLSYNREDQAVARRFAEAFEREGFSVWWDVTLKSGEDFDQVTEQALDAAKAVVVLWSTKSVVSRWVRAEATQADRNRTLVPVTIEPCKRPIMFELKQTADLTHWQGNTDDPAWLAFVGDVHQFVMRGKPADEIQAKISGTAVTLKAKPSVPRQHYRTALVVVFATAVGAAAGLWWGKTSTASIASDANSTNVARFSVTIADAGAPWLGDAASSQFSRPAINSLAISDDGKLIAYTAWDYQDDGSRKSGLYLYRVATGEATLVPDAEGAALPFFSPDGAWLGYATQQGLKRISVAGGISELMVPLTKSGDRITSAHWASVDRVAFTTDEALFLASTNGGAVEQLAGLEVDGHRFTYRGVHWLPDANVVLFHRLSSSDPARSEVAVLDLATHTTKSLLVDAAEPRYAGDNRLLFMRQGNLMAVKLDLVNWSVIGTPILQQANVMQAWSMGNQSYSHGVAQYALSAAGHLVYATGGMYPLINQGQIQAINTAGTTNIGPVMYDIWSLRASPEGDRLLFSSRETNGSIRTYLYDIARDIKTPLIFDSYLSLNPKWSPDGKSVLYVSDRDGVMNVFTQPLDGSSPPRKLAPSEQLQYALDWSSQDVIAWYEDGDIWTLAPQGQPAPWLKTPEDERYARFSPDGQWLAYTSRVSGRNEVYVRPFPGPGQATQISGNGGHSPQWSKDGRTIYYVEQDSAAKVGPKVMQVPVTLGASLVAGKASLLPLLNPWQYVQTDPYDSKDLLPDGSFIAVLDLGMQRLLASSSESPLNTADRLQLEAKVPVGRIEVVLNFAQELEERLP